MLVKFAIEPDAIDDSMTRVDFERLLTAWGYGILVQPIKTITNSIAGLENQSKKHIFTALWERAVHDKGGCRRLSQTKHAKSCGTELRLPQSWPNLKENSMLPF